ncbi:MAG: AAA family ATPase [Candidatus Saccharimonadales bacterium]
MRIIGVGGTNGSGKDTLAQFLADEHGYLFISVSDILREELKKRGLPIERENLRALSAEWRRRYGHGHLIDQALKLFEAKKSQYKGLVVSSLRNPGEAEEVHRLGGTVVWLDGDPKLRYQRIYSRQRSTEDQKTFEQFLAEEHAEMAHHGGDDATLNMGGVKAKADIFITNDNNDIENLKKTAQKALNL